MTKIDSVISQAPLDGHYATPEKVLVDLVVENESLGLMDSSEFTAVFSGVKQAGRLDMPSITRYSLRKEIQDKVLSLVNPVLSEIDVS
ncbi:MAG: hypothetical protein IPP19_05615 [Verrucomicrobia bacterium]|nr:hypothetical protein [Verrucomicrobiota bacterium]